MSLLDHLQVHAGRRFLQRNTGEPFFFLGDTAWELIHRCSREDVIFYLDKRQQQGFTVVETAILAEFDGLHEPNALGDLPLHEDDPTRPQEKYFQYVDWIINEMNRRDMWAGLLPTWGDKWKRIPGSFGPEIFNPKNAYAYGLFLGKRYRDSGVIWILGGDRKIETEREIEIQRAMAEGLREGDGGSHLISFHPAGGHFTAGIIGEPWLDFTMIQSGHMKNHPNNYDLLAEDYAMLPTKPCMEGEPCYENHPVMLEGWIGSDQRFDDYPTRQAAYWGVFAGGHGHTYGSHDVWQFFSPERAPINGANLSWRESINLPGANQMIHLRRLMEERAFFSRIPDQAFILSDVGEGNLHLQATRDEQGSFALVYFPSEREAILDLPRLGKKEMKARWYDPRTGTYLPVETVDASAPRSFTSPSGGPDWVLCLDA
jgi:Protein of unknown function (DUF4038)/Putative collagen-binding domain of a collagenase